ncbi:MAG: TusE/DsrC/DsvC family sulfur relay protein [Gammaproteobacteria bacterium]|nr:TusE/DsrC/DsvC family sulfur relay protein [Gammaproteobacteria bacterium]
MQTQTVDGENPIYQAVAGLHADDLRARVAANAADMGIELNDEHLNVIQVLVNHYQEACQQHDCRAASPHMRYLIGHYAEHGGSSYLYRLFDGLDASAASAQEAGILTLIHRLAGLPDLTHNQDEGFGTIF